MDDFQLLEDLRTGKRAWAVHVADCVEHMRKMPAESVDLIVTDPAYESLEKHRAKGTTTRLSKSKASSNQWFPIFPNGRYEEFFTECYRVLAKNAHLYVYCDKETMFVVKPIAEACGFKWWNVITWDKVKIGMGYHYRARTEFILFFEKGKRKLHDLGMPDMFDFREDPEGFVLECARIRNGYPTEKPVMVSTKLIMQSSEPGQIVFDPFMGSGSVGEAAVRLGRRFVGCDVEIGAVSLSAQRLLQLSNMKQTEMFGAR